MWKEEQDKRFMSKILNQNWERWKTSWFHVAGTVADKTKAITVILMIERGQGGHFDKLWRSTG